MLRSQAELHAESKLAQVILESNIVQILVTFGNGQIFRKNVESKFPETALSLRILHAYFAGHDMTFDKFNEKLANFLERDPYRKNLAISTALEIIQGDWRRRFPSAKKAQMILVVGIDEVQSLLNETAATEKLRKDLLSTTVKAIGNAICSQSSTRGTFLLPLLAGTTVMDVSEAISGSVYKGENLAPHVLDWKSVVAIVKSRGWEGIHTSKEDQLSLVRCLADLGGLPRALELFIECVESYYGVSSVPWKKIRDDIKRSLASRYLSKKSSARFEEDLLRLALSGNKADLTTTCGSLSIDSLQALGSVSLEDGHITMPIIYLVREHIFDCPIFGWFACLFSSL